MDIEALAIELEKTIQKSKDRSKYFSQEIQRLQFKKRKTEEELNHQIDFLRQRLLDSLGVEESVETASFIIFKNYPNIKSMAAYKLEFPTDKESSEQMIHYLKEYATPLIKENITYKPIQKNIKQLIIDEQFHVTDNGFLVDDNGEIVPHIKVAIKKVEPKVKVKKTCFNKNRRHESDD
ncbi:hypothetical protein [Enterococcus sp. DIV1420a]|uniref:hypothetical protein n=1 Tax=Enterococcus sp. DIV1420a TaxID=2774672 RepID=UPI003F21C010